MIYLIEGSDFSGKTTLSYKLQDKFIESGKDCFLISGLLEDYKEEFIGYTQLPNKTDSIVNISYLLLKSFKKVIEYLDSYADKEIIIDRFLPSMYAYQLYSHPYFSPEILLKTYDRKTILDEFKRLNRYFYNYFTVSIIYLEPSIEVIEERKLTRDNNDALDDYFFSKTGKIREGFKQYFNDIEVYLTNEFRLGNSIFVNKYFDNFISEDMIDSMITHNL